MDWNNKPYFHHELGVSVRRSDDLFESQKVEGRPFIQQYNVAT